jgi:isochorismate hydrolase
MPSDQEPSRLALDRERALLLVVDIQEKLIRAMPQPGLDRLLKNATVLLTTAKRLGLPIVASEQYVKGLGPLVARLREMLPKAPVEKLTFSCGASQELAREILDTGRRQVIVVGMEAHVCVFQTVRDLLRGGFAVFLPQDAILSRTEENREIGLRLCEKAGATITSTETILFDLLGTAGTPEFKELAPLIK